MVEPYDLIRAAEIAPASTAFPRSHLYSNSYRSRAPLALTAPAPTDAESSPTRQPLLDIDALQSTVLASRQRVRDIDTAS